MTSLTLLALAIVVLGVASPLGISRALGLSAATATGAAFIVSDRIVIPMFAGVAILILAFAAGRALIAPRRAPVEGDQLSGGLMFLLAFGLWATFITAIAPLLFPEVLVLGTDGGRYSLGSEGLFTVSNFAQLAYLWIGIAVTFLLARSRLPLHSVVEVALAAATLLNLWSLLHVTISAPFPVGFFDNSPNYIYISTAADGQPRFRGIASEPSGLASVANPMIIFAVAAFPAASTRRRVWLGCLAAGALWLGVLSTSTSFVVGNVAMVVLALFVTTIRVAVARLRFRRAVWIVATLAAVAVVLLLPTILDFVAATFSSKFESTSYLARSGSDQFSFSVLLNSYGLGVGVGANRPSSFVASLLSQTGLPGFVLFALAVFLILRSAVRSTAARPVLWVALSFFIGRAFNGPDIGDSTGLTWLLLGSLAYAGQAAERPAFDATWSVATRGRLGWSRLSLPS